MLDQECISKRNLIRRLGLVEHEPCGEAILNLAGENVALEALDSASESEDFDTTGGPVLGLLGCPRKSVTRLPSTATSSVVDGPVMALGGQGDSLLGLRKLPARRAGV